MSGDASKCEWSDEELLRRLQQVAEHLRRASALSAEAWYYSQLREGKPLAIDAQAWAETHAAIRKAQELARIVFPSIQKGDK